MNLNHALHPRWLLVVLLCILGSMFGCATARTSLTVEVPRELAPSQDHVFRAAVHPDTDLSPGFQAVDTDADGSVSTVADGSTVETPEVTDKGGGIKMGGER
jgi:hypothetical protein